MNENIKPILYLIRDDPSLVQSLATSLNPYDIISPLNLNDFEKLVLFSTLRPDRVF